jgi:glycosyltransferase involved in cell wall biosynthesis
MRCRSRSGHRLARRWVFLPVEQTLARPETSSTTENPRLPRVLYIVVMDPYQKFGSMEEQMAFLARKFKNEDSLFLPLFACSSTHEQPTPLEKAGCPIACLDLARFQWTILSRLLALIRQNGIEIVHWNFTPPLFNCYLWWLTVFRPGLKHYYTDHISRNLPLPPSSQGWKKRIKRLLLRRYAKVLCVSRYVFDCLKREDTWSNSVCCRHFVNADRFRPDSRVRARVRADYHVQERFVLLTVAHLIKAKGIDVVLRALTLLPEEVVLWVIGAGVEDSALRILAEELGVTDRVIFQGPQRHVEQFMQGADCFVCPSLWAEAAGLVNIEAQASGLPVVASDVGGIPEYVLDGSTGFLFPPNNAAELADRVRRLLSDRPLAQRFSQAARAFVEEKFSPSARLSEMLALYRF